MFENKEKAGKCTDEKPAKCYECSIWLWCERNERLFEAELAKEIEVQNK